MKIFFSSFDRVDFVFVLYLTSLFASNTLGLKVMPFAFGSHMTVAIFFLPFVFLATDVVGEVYGKKIASRFVAAGLLSTALFLGYSFLSMAMPWSSDGGWVEESYDTVYGTSVRIAGASLVAFAVSQYQDVFSFFLSRRFFGKKHFWLRSLLSNVWSQFFDTTLFMVIAFAGVYPTKTLVSIIFTYWLFRVAMGFAYTPLSYLGVRLLREEKK